MGNRNIGKSVRLISDILEYTDENDIEPSYSLLTLRKHLTRLNTSSSFPPSKHLDLGQILFSGLKRFLKNVESCVMNNGTSTGYFPLERGTRQGDLISAYLSFWLSKSF